MSRWCLSVVSTRQIHLINILLFFCVFPAIFNSFLHLLGINDLFFTFIIVTFPSHQARPLSLAPCQATPPCRGRTSSSPPSMSRPTPPASPAACRCSCWTRWASSKTCPRLWWPPLVPPCRTPPVLSVLCLFASLVPIMPPLVLRDTTSTNLGVSYIYI